MKSFIPVYVPIDNCGAVLFTPDVTSILSEVDKPIVINTPIIVTKLIPFEIQNAALNNGYVSANIVNISDNLPLGIVIFGAYSNTDSLRAVKTRKI